MIEMAEIQERKNNPAKAIEIYKNALMEAEKVSNDEFRLRILLALHNNYKLLGNFEEALTQYRMYHELERKRNESQNVSQLKFLETLHELENSQLQKNIIELKIKNSPIRS